MRYSFRPPSRLLGPFVERLWMCEDEPLHTRERILPSGTVELVFNLLDDEIRIYDPAQVQLIRRFSGAVVSGPYRKCFMIDPLQQASIIGVHFRPGGAFPFFGAVDELADTHIDLDAIWGRSASDLRGRLAEAPSVLRFSLLDKALLVRSHCSWRSHAAVPIALSAFETSGGNVKVRDTARLVGLSQRQFIQTFSREVGLQPKTYARIRRFQRARRVFENRRASDWAAVAIDSGYCDQSHLIRDVREFSGLNPKAFVSRTSPRVMDNHLLEYR